MVPNKDFNLQNLQTFNELKNIYPSLNNIQYKNEILLFPKGSISLNNLSLTSLPKEIFSMTLYNLYIYLSRKFYLKQDENNYRNETQIIINKLPLQELTDNDKYIISQFVDDLFLRDKLYTSEEVLKKDKEFTNEYLTRKYALDMARNCNTTASNYINLLWESYQKKDSGLANQPGKDRPKTLTMAKPGVPRLFSFDDINEDDFQSGFISAFIIIILTIILGILIALKIR